MWSGKHADNITSLLTRCLGRCLRWHTAERRPARHDERARSGHDRALQLDAARDQIQVTLPLWQFIVAMSMKSY